jgi:hypothetical protein
MQKKIIKLPNMKKVEYDPEYDIDDIIGGFEGYFKTKGMKFNKERGASMADRAISGGDNPEAILATLQARHGWVQPIYYSKKQKEKKGSQAPAGMAGRPEFSGVMEDIEPPPDAEASYRQRWLARQLWLGRSYQSCAVRQILS